MTISCSLPCEVEVGLEMFVSLPGSCICAYRVLEYAVVFIPCKPTSLFSLHPCCGNQACGNKHACTYVPCMFALKSANRARSTEYGIRSSNNKPNSIRGFEEEGERDKGVV